MSFIKELEKAAKETQQEKKQIAKKIKNPVFRKYYKLTQRLRTVSQQYQEVPIDTDKEEIQSIQKQLQDIVATTKEFEEYRLLMEETKPLQQEFREKKGEIGEEKKKQMGDLSQKMHAFMKKNIPQLFEKLVPPPKTTLMDKIKGVKGAMSRLKESGIFNPDSYTSEEVAIERTVCCSTCTDGNACPHCGCGIKKKRLLATEDCPNKTTYPHIKTYPPKNYWGVTNEKTSVIIAVDKEPYLNKTIKDLLEKATGKIEVLVGTEEDFTYDDERVKVFIEPNAFKPALLNKLVKEATGKYLVYASGCLIVNHGWDTKFKCICDEDTIVTCPVNGIDEDEWIPKGEKWFGWAITEDLVWKWWTNMKKESDWEKTEEVLTFAPILWMIRKDTYNKIGGHRMVLGEDINEAVEFTCNIYQREGKIKARTDVLASYLFRKQPENKELKHMNRGYIVNNVEAVSKKIKEFKEKYK